MEWHNDNLHQCKYPLLYYMLISLSHMIFMPLKCCFQLNVILDIHRILCVSPLPRTILKYKILLRKIFFVIRYENWWKYYIGLCQPLFIVSTVNCWMQPQFLKTMKLFLFAIYYAIYYFNALSFNLIFTLKIKMYRFMVIGDIWKGAEVRISLTN